MTSHRDRILAASEQHAALLAQINTLSWAPAAVLDSQSKVSDYKASLRSRETELKGIQKRRNERAAKLDKQQGALGKFTRTLSGGRYKNGVDDSDEHMASLQAEQQVEEQIKDLQQRLDDAQALLDRQMEEYDQLQAARLQLDTIQEAVFEGSSYVEVGAAKSAALNAGAVVDRLRNELEAERKVILLIGKATTCIEHSTKSLRHAQLARDVSDAVVGSGFVGDTAARSAHSSATERVNEAKELFAEAIGMQPEVKTPQLPIMFSGESMERTSGLGVQRKVDDVRNALLVLNKACFEELDRARNRKQKTTRNLRTAESKLDNAKEALRTVRAGVIADMLGSRDDTLAIGADAPPMYSTSATTVM